MRLSIVREAPVTVSDVLKMIFLSRQKHS